MTHDFRGPLGNAHNYLEILRRAPDHPQREHLTIRAILNLRSVDRMIVELLDVTRRRAGDRFVLEMNGTIDAYWGCERVKQAVHNLLENALKYGTADTPITVRAEEALGRVILQVHNAGPHIPADEQAKLFHPFSRAVAAEHSRKRGWGLGLMLAQTIAEAHGGSASVDSAEGRGTTFTFDVLRDVRDYKPPPADTGNALS